MMERTPMFLFRLFRSFLPLHNPIGFGADDFVELGLAALLVLLILFHARTTAWLQRLARCTWLSMLLLAVLPVALRLALLPQSPIPTAGGADDFAHLLAGDTLLHGRLANPPHPLHQFFETVFVLQQPAYSSIFPIGQGVILAFGRLLIGHPWAGVVISVAALCSLCYWMLRAWTTPGWALVGGLLAVIEFGPLRYWMNTYWGGAVSATAGCLVFGALPRLRRGPRARDAILLGLGIGVQLLARPFECGLLVLAVILFFAPELRHRLQWHKLVRTASIAVLAALPAVGLMLVQNEQATGSWATLPYALSRYQYGVPTTFTFQPNPMPHVPLTMDQQLDYDAQSAIHGQGPENIGSYAERLAGRVRFYRFFFLPPLYLALPFFLLSLREFRFLWVVLALLIFSLGDNFYPYFYPHYIAAAACLFVLVSVIGLERLSQWKIRGDLAGQAASQLLVILCMASFLFWYGFHLFANENASIAMRQYETWDFVNHGDPDGRIAVNDRLAQAAGKQLVFVRYWPRHRFAEWIHNAADIDKSRIVWAQDLGAVDNEKLRRYYPERTVWLLEPDARPPRIEPYQPEPPPVPPKLEAPSPEQNGIQLLPVP
jgi:hypothetical protein